MYSYSLLELTRPIIEPAKSPDDRFLGAPASRLHRDPYPHLFAVCTAHSRPLSVALVLVRRPVTSGNFKHGSSVLNAFVGCRCFVGSLELVTGVSGTLPRGRPEGPLATVALAPIGDSAVSGSESDSDQGFLANSECSVQVACMVGGASLSNHRGLHSDSVSCQRHTPHGQDIQTVLK